MLVISRKDRERIVMPQLGMTIEVRNRGGKHSLFIDAPKELKIYREEVWREIQKRDGKPDTGNAGSPAVEQAGGLGPGKVEFSAPGLADADGGTSPHERTLSDTETAL